MTNKKLLINKELLIILILLSILIVFILTKRANNVDSNIAYIFQTADIHAYLKHSKRDKNGGLLRLSYVLEREVAKSGGKNNCLLIDCGDTFQGSFESSLSRGDFVITVLNMLKYDIFIPGNHDFDYGISYLINVVSRLNADVLAANLKLGDNISKIKAWKLYNINNIKIAVIGMTSPYIEYWIGKKIFEDYSITSITDELAKIIPSVVENKPDVIVLALHHGLYNSKRFPGDDRLLRNIVKKYPEIDLVLGGHTHQLYSGELIYANSLFVQPGAHGSYLTKVKIIAGKHNKETPKFETELIPVTSELPVNSRVLTAVGKSLEHAENKSGRIITTLKRPVDPKGTPGGKCKITELFSKAVFLQNNVDAVMCTVLSAGKILKGKVTYQNIYEVCPYEDSIMILNLSPGQLKKIFNEQKNFKSKYRKRLGLYVKRNNKIFGIDNIQSFNKQFNEKSKLRVAFSSYDIAGAGNRYPVLKKIVLENKARLFDTKILFRDAVYKFLCNDKQ